MAALVQQRKSGVTLITDTTCPYGVTLAFTERGGGVSCGEFSSLNLGSACGDAADAVRRNRLRALEALGAKQYADNLVCPHQVHGDKILVVHSAHKDEVAAVCTEAAQGADAIVCLAKTVPVMLCFADCVPVILAAPGGFAIAHSGWRGTIAHIAAKTARLLVEQTGDRPEELLAYVGPHIGAPDYEVSQELIDRFVDEFGSEVALSDLGGCHLDLGYAVRMALAEAGVLPEHIFEVSESTATHTDRFFSYRAEHGHCGRHGALAVRLGN